MSAATSPRRIERDAYYRRLMAATAELEAPFAVVDLDAFAANAAALRSRALGKPIRVASKSVRCRGLLRDVLDRPGFQGALAFTLPEALWLAREHDDVLLAYPSVDRAALRSLGASPELATRVTLMVDSVAHLDLIASYAHPNADHPLRLCLDLDASLRLAGGRVHIGARRSPVHGPAEAVSLAREIDRRTGMRLVGMMAYEAQIAGVGDAPHRAPVRGLAVRAMQWASGRELARRRAEAVSAVRSVAPLEFVNGGGTGSVERTAVEPCVTEVAAGSGLYGPGLFDTYRAFRPRPAAFFALPVVRRPTSGFATVLGGGWVASGVPGWDRLPTIAHPAGLRYSGSEGAGEVQTPLRGPGASRMGVADRVWFRHAKAGEVAEHVNVFYLVRGGEIVEEVPTYRGEGKAFL